jgi:hypothetical protein
MFLIIKKKPRTSLKIRASCFKKTMILFQQFLTGKFAVWGDIREDILILFR